MDILLIFTAAIIIARYAEKRSVAFTIGHTILFVFLLLCTLFTTNFTPLQNAMCNAVGDFSYQMIREAILTPYIWFYSTNAVICVMELILMLFIAITATVYVVATILKYTKQPYTPRPSTDCPICPSPVSGFAEGHRIFLRYCKLLN